MLRKLPWRHVHVIGVGGVGTSGLATILMDCGVRVSGSDSTSSTAFQRLQARGADVHLDHSAEYVGNADAVVYSSAVSPDNVERMEAERKGIPCWRRGEFLAELATFYPTVIAVGGSHGKTTTTAMIAHILRESGLSPGFLVGGELGHWSAPAGGGAGRILVTEVDESDGTQASMKSAIAVILNIEDDHSWGLGGIEQLETCFRHFAEGARSVVTWDAPKTREILGAHADVCFLSDDALPEGLTLRVPGGYNRINATLAVAAAQRVGVCTRDAIEALRTFEGVGRRMTAHYTSPDGRITVIEDYAHHPTELAGAMDTFREEYRGCRLIAVFQPHRFERVKRYADAFADLLSNADEVMVVRPFAAWVKDASVADPRSLVDKITGVPSRYWDGSFDDLADVLATSALEHSGRTVIAIIGAGDVTNVIAPLRDCLAGACLDAARDLLTAHLPALVVHRDRAWGECTTLGIGTARPLIAEPSSEDELEEVLSTAGELDLPIFVLGNGSNALGSDATIPALVIRLSRGFFTDIQETGGGWRVGAGVSLTAFLLRLLEKGGLAPAASGLAWVPGTVGGALRMNAGADGAAIGPLVRRVRGIRRDGRMWEASGDSIQWLYRATDIPNDVIITEALFKFSGSHDPGQARRAYREFGERRSASQPTGHTAGSVFRNAGSVSAGELLDRAGCKGLRRGGCCVSTRHANVVVNDGNASESDVIMLAQQMQRRVFDATGVRLVPEVIATNPESAAKLSSALPPVNVCVLKGGPSSEREVSLCSGAAVAGALREAGYAVDEIDITAPELPVLAPGTDVVFPALHGAFGEDGGVQRLLEQRGLPFVGSRAGASQVIMSKVLSKEIFDEHGIPTPAYVVIDDLEAPVPADLTFPLVVKPDKQGSTVGITRLSKPSGWWRRALRKAFECDGKVIVEQFVAGTEITVGVLDGTPLPVIEIVPPQDRMFDFDAKYDHRHGHTHYFCPPRTVPVEYQEAAREVALKVYRVLDAKDMLRVDIIMGADGTPWVLEANSIPGFTATSLLPKAARATGMSFPELCARLVKMNM
ncbi:MAG: D-alanine--D-alanine ligase [Candidatus Pacebacteria bacterium]|nr:D-alanine--D-alanine ligase [Candidatus Paceibacterota bacterium]